MSTQLDPRVLELCGKIAQEQNQATLLRLITELNNVLQRQTGPQSMRDTSRIAAG